MVNIENVRNYKSVIQLLFSIPPLAVAIISLAGIELPFEAAPVLLLLGSMSATIILVIESYESLLKKEEYSLAYALAYGYVNNFLEPVITSLLERPEVNEDLTLYIYMPDRLTELTRDSITRTLQEVKSKGYRTESIKLDFERGRTRDVITIYKESDVRYFDFPNTLMTLNSLIDYKLGGEKESFKEGARIEEGRKHINKFQKCVEEAIENRGMSKYIEITDRNLGFLTEEEGE